jgi:hypothetical protein
MDDRVCMTCNIVVAMADQYEEDRCEPCLETWRWNYMESRVF